MAAPLLAAGAAAVKRSWGRADFVGKGLAAVVVLLVVFYVVVGSVAGLFVASIGDASTGYEASAHAVADIPPPMLLLYQQAGQDQGIDWAVLAAIGSEETDHGRAQLPGVRSGTNSYGCCAGPMQICVIDGCPGGGPRALTVDEAQHGTWATIGVDGNNDGQKDPWDPEDAVPAAAKLLKQAGAPGDYHAAIFAYNHAEWYVSAVMAKAATYRGASVGVGDTTEMRAKLVKLAMATMSTKTGFSRYTKDGATTDDPTPPPPNRTDCSQWVRAIYLEAGLPDPGINTTAQIANGTRTTHPKPGDLMFAADGDHVELYIGNGQTIGHGSPPIDFGTVDYYPGHYFEEYGLG